MDATHLRRTRGPWQGEKTKSQRVPQENDARDLAKNDIDDDSDLELSANEVRSQMSNARNPRIFSGSFVGPAREVYVEKVKESEILPPDMFLDHDPFGKDPLVRPVVNGFSLDDFRSQLTETKQKINETRKKVSEVESGRSKIRDKSQEGRKPISGSVTFSPARAVGEATNENGVPDVVPASEGFVTQQSYDKNDFAQCQSWKSGYTDLDLVRDMSDKVAIDGRFYYMPVWQRKRKLISLLGGSGGGYCVTEILQVRIYDEDKAKWTIRELKQWIHYMLLAGVDHIYLCDHYNASSEKLDTPLKAYIKQGIMTYIPWGAPEGVTRSAIDAQLQCYDHVIRTYGHLSPWQIALDMDEYPFSVLDTAEGFLVRYLHHITKRQGAKVSEIALSNYLMLGRGNLSQDMVISRINRIVKKPENGLVKPIFRPDRMTSSSVHHMNYKVGTRIDADPDEMKMLHYWGSRLQKWGPDTREIRERTVPMEDMEKHWADAVRNSLIVFGELDSFSNSTGP